MIRITFITMYILIFLTCCGILNSEDESIDQNGDIQEAALRYYFGSNGSGMGSKASNYYLAEADIIYKKLFNNFTTLDFKNRRDPIFRFYSRFENVTPKVLLFSSLSVKTNIVYELQNRNSLLFVFSKPKLIADLEYELYVGYYETWASAEMIRLQMRYENGSWKVVLRETIWVS